jgi:hypothetical protein
MEEADFCDPVEAKQGKLEAALLELTGVHSSSWKNGQIQRPAADNTDTNKRIHQ